MAGTMKVLLFQVDGKLPNHALMRLSTWHRTRGDRVRLTDSLDSAIRYNPNLVYSSSIFTYSSTIRKQVAMEFPDAITGGDGYRPIWNDLTIIGRDQGSNLREVITDCDPELIPLEYSHYPNFTASLGYTQRGCRLNCSFCRMQTREGKVRNVASIYNIWRGDPYPQHIHLLDNDFFGQPEWRDILNEAIEGDFRVCFNQGINIRLITEEQATVLSHVRYTDDSFKSRRLYTAWDNLGDESIFRRGVSTITRGGIPASHLMVYMLIGFRKNETEDEVLYRFNSLKSLGCHPYPMPFNRTKLMHCRFQKWVVGRYHEVCTWQEFKDHHKSRYEWDQDVDYVSRYGKALGA
jgi:hypothetical protein